MSKIYQKMYLKKKSPAKSVLDGFIHNVILKCCYAEFQPCFDNGIDEKAHRRRSRITTLRDDLVNGVILRSFYSESRPCSVKRTGFTLIELLVVVLIIGILAAVALPQYTRAVAKARLAEGLTVGKSIVNAEQVYKMANGDYTADMDLLDVSLPAGGTVRKGDNFYQVDYSSKQIRYVLQQDGGWRLDFYTPDLVVQRIFDWSTDQCVVRNGSETGRYLCRALGAAANCDTVCSIPKL